MKGESHFTASDDVVELISTSGHTEEATVATVATSALGGPPMTDKPDQSTDDPRWNIVLRGSHILDESHRSSDHLKNIGLGKTYQIVLPLLPDSNFGMDRATRGIIIRGRAGSKVGDQLAKDGLLDRLGSRLFRSKRSAPLLFRAYQVRPGQTR